MHPQHLLANSLASHTRWQPSVNGRIYCCVPCGSSMVEGGATLNLFVRCLAPPWLNGNLDLRPLNRPPTKYPAHALLDPAGDWLLLQQDGYRSVQFVSHGKIEFPITIEVRSRDCGRALPHRIGRVGSLCERSIAVP
jgi:hypothetical protein